MMGTFVGARPFFNDAVAGTKVTLKSGNGQLILLKIVNTTGATAYLQIFDQLAANVTVGTTTPDWTIRLAASESTTIALYVPYAFANGMVLAGTTTATGSTGAAVSVSALFE